MRLLYVCGTFPKVSETFVANEVRGLVERGHDVRVVTVRPGERGVDDPELWARTWRLPRAPVPRRLPTRVQLSVPEDRPTRRGWALAAASHLAPRVRAFRPDLVHAHFANLPTLLAGLVARGQGVPYTFTAHASDYRSAMSGALLRRRLLHADATFAISAAARQDLLSRARLTPDQVRLEVVRAASRAVVAPRTAPRTGGARLAVVARLVPMKGVDLVLRALPLLRGSCPGLALDVVGDGPERAALHALADELGVADLVTFHGTLPPGPAQQVLASADAAVLASRIDSAGRADGVPVFLLEAALLGVPVVTTAISGLPELVTHERTGLVVPVDDPRAVAAAVHRLLTDPDLAARLATGLHRRVQEEFDAERQLDRLEASWRRLLEGV